MKHKYQPGCNNLDFFSFSVFSSVTSVISLLSYLNVARSRNLSDLFTKQKKFVKKRKNSSNRNSLKKSSFPQISITIHRNGRLPATIAMA